VLLLIGLGAATGILGGFFGVGGGWVITPALNIFGLPMPYAVGTGLAYVFGMALISAWRHRRHGHTALRLAFGIGVPMMAGIQIGKVLVLHLERFGKADSTIRWVYILFLAGLGGAMILEYMLGRRKTGADEKASRANVPWLARIGWPPVIRMPVAGVDLSLWALMGAGLFTGVLAGVLGVGGGFLLMPMMVYLMGVPTVVAVGTSLVCLVISSPFGVITYSGVLEWIQSAGSFHEVVRTATDWAALVDVFRRYGRVEFGAAGLMVLGAAAGAPVGVWASGLVHGRILRLLYAVMILLGGVSIALKQFGLHAAARLLILGIAVGMSVFIVAAGLVMAARAGRREGEQSREDSA